MTHGEHGRSVVYPRILWGYVFWALPPLYWSQFIQVSWLSPHIKREELYLSRTTLTLHAESPEFSLPASPTRLETNCHLKPWRATDQRANGLTQYEKVASEAILDSLGKDIVNFFPKVPFSFQIALPTVITNHSQQCWEEKQIYIFPQDLLTFAYILLPLSLLCALLVSRLLCGNGQHVFNNETEFQAHFLKKALRTLVIESNFYFLLFSTWIFK